MKLSTGTFDGLFKKAKKLIYGSKTAPSSNPPPSQKAPVEVPKTEPVRIVQEDGLFFAITGSNKVLKCGSVHSLLNYLIDVRMNDLGVIYAFLLHHKLFIPSFNLLEIIVEKWKEKADDNSDHGKAEVFRVANILKFWIDSFFTDIKNDSKSSKLITEFFKSQLIALRQNNMFLVLSESIQQKFNFNPELQPIKVINAPKSIIPIAINGPPGFVILDFSAVELARQLTLLEFQIFQGINAREFLESNWKKKDKNLAPNITKLSQWSNSVIGWMISEILSVKDLKNRAATLQRVISVGDELVKIKNFDTIKVIAGTIYNPNISRLRKTFNLLPQDSRDSLKNIMNLISDKDDYQALREKMNTLSPPILPLLELCYSDLQSKDKLGDLFQEKDDEKWVNVEKMVATSFVIKGTVNLQKSRFHFGAVKEIQDHIYTYQRLSVNDMEEASTKLEP